MRRTRHNPWHTKLPEQCFYGVIGAQGVAAIEHKENIVMVMVLGEDGQCRSATPEQHHYGAVRA
jgi:hypothetical protein